MKLSLNLHEVHVIHPIKMISRQNQNVLNMSILGILHNLSYVIYQFSRGMKRHINLKHLVCLIHNASKDFMGNGLLSNG